MLGYLNKSCVHFKVELIVRRLGMVPRKKVAGKKVAGKN
jgi:hypothetical protein